MGRERCGNHSLAICTGCLADSCEAGCTFREVDGPMGCVYRCALGCAWVQLLGVYRARSRVCTAIRLDRGSLRSRPLHHKFFNQCSSLSATCTRVCCWAALDRCLRPGCAPRAVASGRAWRRRLWSSSAPLRAKSVTIPTGALPAEGSFPGWRSCSGLPRRALIHARRSGAVE